MSHCHCSQCRKGHGAAFSSYDSVTRIALRILRGANSLCVFADGIARICAECGSTLFWPRCEGELADWISVTLGTLDTHSCPRCKSTST
ncbi:MULTISPECIES: GFA family protein [unclassified Pseudomonas]|uniref:GFA family protein n=1 Tax=unclassified Pseudomonas TaxID=196821 RepID=UPI0021157E39|nr:MULTISPECIES: GFA family protein [unclassified Pseudomonas]